MASSCDDDFGLLGDEAQSHHIHIHPHPHPHALPHSHHPQPQQAAPSPFVTHRFVTTSTTKGAVPIHAHAHHPFDSIASSKKGVGGGGGDDDEEDDDPGDYGEAFAQADASSKLPTPNAFHHDVNPHHCFAPADAATDHPFTHQPQGGDEEGTENHGHKLAVGAPAAHPSRPDVKRKDRDELSDGGSPYCFNSSGGNGKKPRAPSASSGMPSSSSGDYRKDREEWSDSGIGCLLDAYTEKYIQLNRGNLRGRDWEDVASIVSERCDKQKSCKSVEQCKNKVDNLKKRYKAERQRLSSGSLSVSHWPWFKKMEQIVGSSSSSSSKPVSDDDKSAAAPGGGCGGGGGASATAAAPPRQAKRYSVATPGPVSLTNNLKMKALSNPRWRRVVLKISGAAFAGNGPQNVDPKVTMLIAREIAIANRLGVEVAIVVGGRNFFCGDTWAAATGIDRSTAYQIGMMATMMNSILLQASLEKIGVQTRVQTAFTIQEIAEPYIRRRAIRHLEKGRVVIFGGIGAGIGNPLFTTDTAAALRASEINADAVLKGTNIDGAYDCHSRDSNNTAAFDHLSFRELVSRGFTAMDMTAISFCEENSIPVVVFNLLEPGNISRAICGDQVGTLIDQSGRAG